VSEDLLANPSPPESTTAELAGEELGRLDEARRDGDEELLRWGSRYSGKNSRQRYSRFQSSL